MDRERILKDLDLDCYISGASFNSILVGKDSFAGGGEAIENISSIDGRLITQFKSATTDQIGEYLPRTLNAFDEFRNIPAPIRGKLVKIIAKNVEAKKTELAKVITMEMGKTINEAKGEVQEWIDICDFAVGLSRQLTGATIATERSNHRLMEQWHPLGPVLVISAFNFPMAVWAWNAMLGFVCGDSIVWKPSEQTPLCALSCHKIVLDSIQELEGLGTSIPTDIHSVYIAGATESKIMVENPIFPLVSATGSIPMGRDVAQRVAKRLGRSLLELGGNNAMIISGEADIELASRAAIFSAVGTTGQRCTSLRRLITHESVVNEVCEKLVKSYQTLNIGDPFDKNNFIGPLTNKRAYDQMMCAIEAAKDQGGELIYGGERVSISSLEGGYYVTPAIIKINSNADIVQEETFAPILYVMTYKTLDEAIAINNGVMQGLSSAIFSNNMREVEKFMSARGSDCGLVNVNVGTSGAEIGGAFGGEKETGGGRESGSDSWKSYMRRTTNTINYSNELPLAQGVKFDL